MRKLWLVFFVFLLILTGHTSDQQMIAAYEWDFGDGSPVSFEQNPGHVYRQPGTYTWNLKVTINGETCVKSGRITIRDSVPAEIGVSRRTLYFGSAGGSTTAAQELAIAKVGQAALEWRITGEASWVNAAPYAGTGGETVRVSVNPAGLAPGMHTGKLLITDPYAWNSPQEVEVVLKVSDVASSSAPIGFLETPEEGGTGISGAIPVTGWVVDDIEPAKVEIWRDPASGEGTSPVYIGEATFVKGARPDIEQAYRTYPLADRAGWGYMLLTNTLPNGGNGSYRIQAIAEDKEGHRVILGSKTITCDNANAVKPFGTIDTPAQGGTAAGRPYVNFGWVLTPQPYEIPRDGSTISVWVDGVRVGQAVYDQYREDVARAFPGLKNTSGAVGYFELDTTKYGNGVHTINWLAENDGGFAEGIGARYFTISNVWTCCSGSGAEVFDGVVSSLPRSRAPIGYKIGYRGSGDPEIVTPDDQGVIHLRVRETERIELQFGRPVEAGFLAFGDDPRPLPIGSTLDKEHGIFSWQPGPGFIGAYGLMFVDGVDRSLRDVEILIGPKYPKAERDSRGEGPRRRRP
jgi:PKD repeat protein